MSSPTDPRIEAINRSPWFTSMPEEGREFLFENSRLRKLVNGERLIIRGDPCDAVYGVIEGRVRVGATSSRGQEVNVGDHAPGGWLGENSLLDGFPALLDAAAIEPALVVVIPVDALRQAGKRWPVLYKELLRDALQKMRIMYGLFELVTAHTLSVRVAIRLLGLFRDHGRRTGKGAARLNVKITQGELATLSYGTRQHINRILSAWADEGFLNVKGDYIECSDFTALVAKAGETGFSLD